MRPKMPAPRLPWPEPDFSYTPVYDMDDEGNVVQINAPDGTRVMGGAGAYNAGADSGQAGLSHALHGIIYNDPLPLIGRPWGGTGTDYTSMPDDQRLATAQEHQQFVDSVIQTINDAPHAIAATSSLYSTFANADPSQPFRPNYTLIGAEVMQAATGAASLGEFAMVIPEIAGTLAYEFLVHEARAVADPLLPGDSFGDKLVNAALMSVGIDESHFVGDYRPDNPFENALPEELALQRFNDSHWGDSSYAANAERARLAAAVEVARAARDTQAAPAPTRVGEMGA